jgi:hypothetical protein
MKSLLASSSRAGLGQKDGANPADRRQNLELLLGQLEAGTLPVTDDEAVARVLD